MECHTSVSLTRVGQPIHVVKVPKATVDSNTFSESDLSDVFDLMAAELSHAKDGLIILPQKEHGMSLIMGETSKKHWKDMLANGSELKHKADDALTKQFEGLVRCSGSGSGGSWDTAWGRGKSPVRKT